LALHQRGNLAVAVAENQVAFPVTGSARFPTAAWPLAD
jgi:hypothetical protein